MFKIQYKSIFTGLWCESHLGNFSTKLRAQNAATKELHAFETRVVPA